MARKKREMEMDTQVPASPAPVAQNIATPPHKPGQYKYISTNFSILITCLALCSFDGRAASLFPNVGIFVTTPNMDIVYAPLGQCKTRLRRQNHYGQDDPGYWPQPFHSIAGHLAVIPSPQVSENQPLYWAWYQPILADFQSVRFSGLNGMVRLSTSLQESLKKMSTMVLSTILILPEDLRKDSLAVQICDQLYHYLERLGECNSQKMVSLELAGMQRCILELYARGQWLENWVQRFRNIESSYDVDSTVMGSFTDDLDTAATLFRVGIPVWLVHPYEKRLLTRIDQIVSPLCESVCQQLPVRNSDFIFDIADSNPPHPTIYTGIPGHFKRYKRMQIYARQQFSSSLVGSFEDEFVATPSSSSMFRPTSMPSGTSQPQLKGKDKSKVGSTALQSTVTLSWLDPTSREWVSSPQPKKRARKGVYTFYMICRNSHLLSSYYI